MNHITLTTRQTTTKEVNVPIETYWRYKMGHKYVGIINTENIYTVMTLPKYVLITNDVTPPSDLLESYEPCTEQEFFDAYNEARALTDLTPSLTPANGFGALAE